MRDFDDLVRMYQEDPDGFDRERREVINDFIEHLPNENCKLKARQLQFRIDRELHSFKDPTARMNRMVELFWEEVKEFQYVLATCQENEDNPVPISARTQPKAPVIQLSGHNKDPE